MATKTRSRQTQSNKSKYHHSSLKSDTRDTVRINITYWTNVEEAAVIQLNSETISEIVEDEIDPDHPPAWLTNEDFDNLLESLQNLFSDSRVFLTVTKGSGDIKYYRCMFGGSQKPVIEVAIYKNDEICKDWPKDTVLETFINQWNDAFYLKISLTKRMSKTFPFNADSYRQLQLGCVGVNDVIYFEITYWVDQIQARAKQSEMIATKESEKYENFCSEPWFSTDDFNKLQQRLKLACEFDVCVRANQGSGYFSYSCASSGSVTDCEDQSTPSQPPPVVRPLVLVTEYRAGVLQQGGDVDKNILSLMDNRWGGAFCVFPGPLLSDNAQISRNVF